MIQFLNVYKKDIIVLALKTSSFRLQMKVCWAILISTAIIKYEDHK